MRTEDIPQDKSTLGFMTRELCYAKNSDGTYDTVLSTGWEVKTEALDYAWDGIKERVQNAKAEVEQGRKSPIYFHMEKNLMDPSLLAEYVNFSRIRVWLHFKPSIYKRLSARTLQKYATVFNIDPNQLNTLQ